MPISLYEQHEEAEKSGKFFVAALVNIVPIVNLGFPVVPAAIAGVGAVAYGLRSIPLVDNIPVVGSLLATTEQVCFETAAAGINRANWFAGSEKDSKESEKDSKESEKDSKESEKDSKESKKGSKGLEWKKYFEKLAKEAEESRQNKEYNYFERVFGKGDVTVTLGKLNKGLNNFFDGTIAVASAVGATPFKAVGGLLNYTSDTITLATHLIDNVAIKNLDELSEGLPRLAGKLPKLIAWTLSTTLKFGQAPISGAGQVCDSVGEALLTPAKQLDNEFKKQLPELTKPIENGIEYLQKNFNDRKFDRNDLGSSFIKFGFGVANIIVQPVLGISYVAANIIKEENINFLSNSKDRLEATFEAEKISGLDKINVVNEGVLQLGFKPKTISLKSVKLENLSERFKGEWYSSPLTRFTEIKENLKSSEKNQLRAINSEAEKISELSKERTKALEELQKALTSKIEKELKTTPTLDLNKIKTALIEKLEDPTATGTGTGTGTEIAQAAINSLNPKALKALKNLAELTDSDKKIKELVEPAFEAAKKSNNEKSEEAKTKKMKDLAAPTIKKLANELIDKNPAPPAPTSKKEPPTAFGKRFAKPVKEDIENSGRMGA